MLIGILALAIGLVFGFIFGKRQKIKSKIFGEILVSEPYDDNEVGDVYLKLNEDVSNLCSVNAVTFNVKHVSHK